MPSTSKKQEIAMAIAAKGESNIGIPQKVGQEFHAADVAKKDKKPKGKMSKYLDGEKE
jgi:hypothetical protein